MANNYEHDGGRNYKAKTYNLQNGLQCVIGSLSLELPNGRKHIQWLWLSAYDMILRMVGDGKV